jgi:RNA polymerase sigma factor (sigma-70 family)
MLATVTDPEARADAVALGSEVESGRRLDRDLARRLGRHEPDQRSDPSASLEALTTQAGPDTDLARRLVARARTGDAGARAELIEAYMPALSAMARTYRNGRITRQELLQEGVVGLLRALERFDPDRGVAFWSYASFWVRQAMQHLVAELTRPLVLSDRALRHLSQLKQLHHDELQRSGREPTRAQLAERSGLDPGHIDDLVATEAGRSLDEPVRGVDGELGSFGDLLVDPMAEQDYDHVLGAIESEALHSLLAGLSERERHVLALRYGLDDDELSLRQVGERLGLSGERVRQLERRALAKLGSAMGAPGLTGQSTAAG